MRVSKILSYCLFAGLANCAWPAFAAGRPLQILVEDAASPWSKRDGGGYANDLVRAAYAAAGVDIELVVVPYARCKAIVLHGGAAACFSMSAAPELGDRVRLADKPLYSVIPRFYYNVSGQRLPSSVAEFPRGLRVGIVRGYEYPAYVTELARRGIIFDNAPSDVINLRKLAANRIDVALVMTGELRKIDEIQRQAGVHDIGFAFQSAPMESYLGFSAAHPDSETLRRRFNAGYEAIIRNGTKRSIDARWRQRCAKSCPE